MAARPSNKDLRTFVHEPQARSQLLDRVVELLIYGSIASVAALVFLISAGLVAPLDIPLVGGWIHGAIDFDPPLTLLHRAGIGAGSVLVALFANVLLTRPYRMTIPGPRKLVVAADDRGVVLVAPSSVCAVAIAPVLRIPGVVTAKAELIARGTSPLRLKLNIEVVPSTALKEVGDEARLVASKAVEELVGLEVQAVLVNFTVVEVTKLTRALQ